MCIIGVAVGCHADFPLVCIHNRDEEAGPSIPPPSLQLSRPRVPGKPRFPRAYCQCAYYS